MHSVYESYTDSYVIHMNKNHYMGLEVIILYEIICQDENAVHQANIYNADSTLLQFMVQYNADQQAYAILFYSILFYIGAYGSICHWDSSSL